MTDASTDEQHPSMQQSRRGLLRAGVAAGSALALGAVATSGMARQVQAQQPVSAGRESVTLASAQAMIAAGIAKARELGVAMAIVVVDESDVLKAFVRMDGNSLASVELVMEKAYTAAAFRAPTHVLAERNQSDPVRLASLLNAPRVTFLGGGYPIMSNGAVAGAVAAGGGSPQQDMEVAEAALAALA